MKIWKYVTIIFIVCISLFILSEVKTRIMLKFENQLDNLIEQEMRKQASKLMKDEIIRQLNEKLGEIK